MLLNEYQWSLNPRGMHNSFVYKGPTMDRVKSLQFGWYKMAANGSEFLGDCQTLLSNNVTPIIRIFRPSPGAMPVDPTLINEWKAYASAGVKWFEFYNEPNLINEWPSGDLVFNPDNVAQIISPIMENWLTFAETIINMGCYPAFPALAEAQGHDQGTIPWLDAMLTYLRDKHRDLHAESFLSRSAGAALYCP